MTRPATIYDVAARAKLSIATVSRVLQGTGQVSESARARVQQAAKELDYVPLRAARSLAVQRHEAHGLVLPDLSGPFYGDVVMGYERWAGERGQSVIITVTHGRDDRYDALRDLAGRVDGLVVFGNALEADAIQQLRRMSKLPVVLISRRPMSGCDSVRSESASSAERLTGRLLDHGRRKLRFVGDPASGYDVAERYTGFVAAHTARRLAAAKPVQVPLTEAAGQMAGENWLSGSRAGGLVCANDELALAAMDTLRRGGADIPGDVVVTGWDDVMAARYVSPGLTTVRQPMAELGRIAALRLHERIAGERNRSRNDVLATEIVLRESCGTREEAPPL